MKIHNRSPTIKEVRKSEQCRHTFRITVAKCAPCDGYNLNCEHAVHQVIESPVEEHSKKPEETRRRIVELLGDVPRIELFARQRSPGWDVWGNEIGEQDEK